MSRKPANPGGGVSREGLGPCIRRVASRRRLMVMATLAGAILSLVGCSLSVGTSPGRAVTIPVRVKRGAQHARAVILPIYIDNTGPYEFGLDTGAAKSVVDSRLATRLGLRQVGPVPGGIIGIVSSEPALEVQVTRWRVDSVVLRPGTMIATSLPAAGGADRLQGLLGSDQLSWFRSVTVNYQRQLVTFDQG